MEDIEIYSNILSIIRETCFYFISNFISSCSTFLFICKFSLNHISGTKMTMSYVMLYRDKFSSARSYFNIKLLKLLEYNRRKC